MNNLKALKNYCTSAMSQKEKIDLIALIIFVGFCLSFYFSLIVYDLYLEKDLWSKVGIFFAPTDKFNDFKHAILNPNIVTLEPYELSGKSMINGYFPFTYILFRPFIFISENDGLAIFFTTFTLGMVYANYKFLSIKNGDKIEFIRNVFIFSFLTYPFLFTIDRANIEGWLLLFYAGFLLTYNKKMYKTAAIIIGCAAAIKFYPGMFAFFFLKDKKYKEFGLFVIFTSLITLLSLLIFKGTVLENIQGLMTVNRISELAFAIGMREGPRDMAHLIEMARAYTMNPNNMYGVGVYEAGVRYSSSLFGFIKIIILSLHLENSVSTNVLFFWFKVASPIIGLLIFIYLLKYENEKWKIAMFLASYFTLFIHTSFNYKLLVFFVPLWLFINSKEKSKYNFTYAVLLALIMIPKHYTVSHDFDIAAILNPIFMLAICVISIIEKARKNA